MIPTTFNPFNPEQERSHYHDNFIPQPLPPNYPRYGELDVDYPVIFNDFINIYEETTSYYNEFSYDTSDFPTKSYSYNFDGIAPEFEIIKQRTTANNTIDIYYFYDGFANLIQIKTPSEQGQIIKNLFYDGLFRVKEEQNPYFATFSINITNASSTTNKTQYQYDALSRPIKIINPDGTIKITTYNKSIINDYDENNNRHTYILDAYDRITEVQEHNTDFYIGDNEIYNTTYEYNGADELTKITDAYGNQFKFEYDSLGRKIKLEDPDLGTWTYTYDLAGNLISQVGGGGNLVTGDSYYREYNGLGQLKSVKDGNNSNGRLLEEYFYDANNDRIKVIRTCYTAGCSNETIYTPYREWMQIKNSSGVFNFYYVYQDNVLVSRLNADGTKYYYHPDHLGSTTLITDENGNKVEDEFYSPFGESLDSNNAEEFKLYTGQFKDTTGMYYYGSRYYKPDWTTFTQCDKIKPGVYNPQSLNCYSYGLNNPYRYKDDSGNTPWDVVDAGLWALDVKDYQENPGFWTGASLIISTITLFPVLPNVVGYVKYGIKGVDEASDAVRSVDKASDVAKAADKTTDTTKVIDKGSDATKATQKITSVGIKELPKEAQETIKLIEKGGPFPYKKDASIFRNKEGLLPKQPIGHYREYTVKTPNVKDRGAQRIIVGKKGKIYYTKDHYKTFTKVSKNG